LPAGNVTIGLRTKKISGEGKARNRIKMKEGTWIEKPNRNTPTSQDEGKTRKHWECEKTSLRLQHTTQRKTATQETQDHPGADWNLQGNCCLNLDGNCHRLHPDVNMDEAQIDTIQEKILQAIDAKAFEEAPSQFLYSKFAQGVFWITCANEPSKTWLTRKVSGIGELWEGAELTVVDSKDFLKRLRLLVHIPDTCDVNPVLTRLRKQNPELHTSNWSVMSRKVIEKEQALAFCMDPDFFKALAKLHFKAFWGLGRITFRTLKETKNYPEAESSSSKFAPQ
jgi:hypothetical protein